MRYDEDMFFSNQPQKQHLTDFTNKASWCMENHQGDYYTYIGNYPIQGVLANYKQYLDLVPEKIHHFGVHSQDYWNDHPTVECFKRLHNIDYLTVGRINCSIPGSTTRQHFDYEIHVVKYYQELVKQIKNKHVSHRLMFLQDQQPGQTFNFGKQSVEWKAGDTFSFPWYMIHGGANKSQHERWVAHFAIFEGIE